MELSRTRGNNTDIAKPSLLRGEVLRLHPHQTPLQRVGFWQVQLRGTQTSCFDSEQEIAQKRTREIPTKLAWTFFGHFSDIFDKIAEKMLKNVENMSKNVENCQKMSKNCRKMSKNCRKIVEKLSKKCRKMLEKCRRNCRKMSKNVEKCRKLVGKCEKCRKIALSKDPPLLGRAGHFLRRW